MRKGGNLQQKEDGWWDLVFQASNSVAWLLFFRELSLFLLRLYQDINDLTLYEESLKFIVTKTETVRKDDFLIFISRFGPMEMCLMRIKENVISEDDSGIRIVEWFHGDISRQEVNILTSSSHRVGSFLVRFSESMKHNFALHYIISESEVGHVMIYNHGSRGYSLSKKAVNCFPNIPGNYYLSITH